MAATFPIRYGLVSASSMPTCPNRPLAVKHGRPCHGCWRIDLQGLYLLQPFAGFLLVCCSPCTDTKTVSTATVSGTTAVQTKGSPISNDRRGTHSQGSSAENQRYSCAIVVAVEHRLLMHLRTSCLFRCDEQTKDGMSLTNLQGRLVGRLTCRPKQR